MNDLLDPWKQPVVAGVQIWPVPVWSTTFIPWWWTESFWLWGLVNYPAGQPNEVCQFSKVRTFCAQTGWVWRFLPRKTIIFRVSGQHTYITWDARMYYLGKWTGSIRHDFYFISNWNCPPWLHHRIFYILPPNNMTKWHIGNTHFLPVCTYRREVVAHCGLPVSWDSASSLVRRPGKNRSILNLVVFAQWNWAKATFLWHHFLLRFHVDCELNVMHCYFVTFFRLLPEVKKLSLACAGATWAPNQNKWEKCWRLLFSSPVCLLFLSPVCLWETFISNFCGRIFLL